MSVCLTYCVCLSICLSFCLTYSVCLSLTYKVSVIELIQYSDCFVDSFHQAPPGVKKNLLRTYESWTPEYVGKNGMVVRSQALFALAWFHAVMQERRNYIPQVSHFISLSVKIVDMHHILLNGCWKYL